MQRLWHRIRALFGQEVWVETGDTGSKTIRSVRADDGRLFEEVAPHDEYINFNTGDVEWRRVSGEATEVVVSQ